MSEQGLARKVAWGSVWSIALNVASRSLGLISILILARLITPYDLGVYAAAAVVVELVHILTEVGIYPALIQRKNPSRDFYQTAWTVQVIRGFGIFVIVQILALYFIELYSDDAMVQQAIQVVAISTILHGFSSIYLVNFQKHIDFQSLLKFDMTCRILGFIATIAAAYYLRSFWALVVGNIVLAVSRLILSHIYARGPHRLTLKSSGDLLHVSRWILVHEIGAFVSLKSDTFLITRFLGPQTLGIYEVGYQVAMAPTQEIALPISRALFPGLAKLQEHKEKFTEMLTFTLASIFYIALPAGMGLILIADPLVATLFPEEWHDAAHVIQMLAIFGVARAVFGPCVSALMGKGHMKLNAMLTLFNVVLRVSALSYGLFAHGFEGLLAAAALIAVVQAMVYIFVLVKIDMLMLPRLLTMSWRAAAAALVMSFVLALLLEAGGLLSASSSAVTLLASVSAGAVIYLTALLGVWAISGRPAGIEEAVYVRLARRFS